MATFFHEAVHGNGFDETAKPVWQMVPLGSFKRIELSDAAGLDVVSKDTSIATVEEAPSSRPGHRDRAIIVNGKAAGVTTVEARSNGTPKATVEVAVKAEKKISVCFTSVSDNAGHATRRAPTDGAHMVDIANIIYWPQANVRFEIVPGQSVTVNQDLKAKVPWAETVPPSLADPASLSGSCAGAPAGDVFCNFWVPIFRKGSPNAQLNVFFVNDIDNPGVEAVTTGRICGTGGRGYVLFKDKIKLSAGQVLAHEAGHYLLCTEKHSGKREHLMFKDADPASVLIPRGQANFMNP